MDFGKYIVQLNELLKNQYKYIIGVEGLSTQTNLESSILDTLSGQICSYEIPLLKTMVDNEALYRFGFELSPETVFSKLVLDKAWT